MSNTIDQQVIDFQSNILRQVASLKPQQKLVDVLSQLLGISQNAAYKKIQGNSNLSIEDLLILTRELGISLDQFVPFKSSPIPFMVDVIRKLPSEYLDFFLNLRNHMNYLTDLKGMSYINLAGEVPFFHMMPFDYLFNFKLYVYNYTTWNISGYNRTVDTQLIQNNPELKKVIDHCIKAYYDYEGIEIWNIRMLDITWDQIKYFIQLRAFPDRNSVYQIIYDIENLLQHLSQICEKGMKIYEAKNFISKAKVKIYMNELTHSNDVFFIHSNTQQFAFHTFNTPNFMRTGDPRFVKHTKAWLDFSLKHTSLISGEGEKDRIALLQVIHQKFEKAKREIEGLLAVKYD